MRLGLIRKPSVCVTNGIACIRRADEQRFLLYKQTIKKQIRKSHAAYVHKLFTDSSKSELELSKSFWTYVKHRRSQAISSVGPLKSGNTIATQSRDKAEILNKQFISVFSKPSERLDYHPQTLHSKMKDIILSEAGVLKQLKSLKTNKACGPDGIPPRVLKELAHILAAPLTTLFQTTLDKGVVP